MAGAGVDLFVIWGTTVSAEHVSTHGEPLNLKRFIYELDVPVIVGGWATVGRLTAWSPILPLGCSSRRFHRIVDQDRILGCRSQDHNLRIDPNLYRLSRLCSYRRMLGI